jgi:PAP2 superfamily protein
MRRLSPALLFATAGVSAFAFAALARAVNRRKLQEADVAARDQVQASRTMSGDKAADAASSLGSERVHGPIAVAMSLYLARHGVGVPSILPVVASAVTAATSEGFEQLTSWQAPPPGHPKQHEASFPSGHALETSALGLTSAYILARERLVPAAPALAAVATISMATTASRIYLDRHWLSDAVGGWLLGIATAAALCAAYETYADTGSAGIGQSLPSIGKTSGRV